MRSWRGPTLALLLVGTAPLLPANIGGPYGPMCPVPSEQVISSDKEPERLIASLLTIGLGRRHFPRIEPQADTQEDDQNEEYAQGEQEATHECSSLLQRRR
ncbi:MAG: hypothetical protein KA175_03750, partial [Flavobacteriales bacterium]|nr:hypothetical protein [Flavobacteriales bacterium]